MHHFLFAGLHKSCVSRLSHYRGRVRWVGVVRGMGGVCKGERGASVLVSRRLPAFVFQRTRRQVIGAVYAAHLEVEVPKAVADRFGRRDPSPVFKLPAYRQLIGEGDPSPITRGRSGCRARPRVTFFVKVGSVPSIQRPDAGDRRERAFDPVDLSRPGTSDYFASAVRAALVPLANRPVLHFAGTKGPPTLRVTIDWQKSPAHWITPNTPCSFWQR